MKLEPREAKDDFVYGALKMRKTFLVQGSHGEGEWCCDVCDYPRLGQGEESGYERMFRKETRAWSLKFPMAPESTRGTASQ